MPACEGTPVLPRERRCSDYNPNEPGTIKFSSARVENLMIGGHRAEHTEYVLPEEWVKFILD
jgi:hypothetical protein